ncbi:hypothetical protein A3C23_01695 [Candidatus Roizmanbacteria bacterium RIFCSPHIGHO2_02_FULL_37_13b]|uniref:Methyltransferase domain-containing protein n=1 Tax=Candidatus Roizmanbacteria bacterium RIFCSPLOWO2_02_FULL_36_11 TaxID=1802071 RepID=A0A1F7JCV1_9BACT|nr:MAG: hypothetical protein A3C23_01695 [Candidatus Roizmanbacteria bacterium RIFCSPHIGHO2_02_FULL_37_13b]OGK53450.1 MAG: hypothetical protein A3H78_02855 [Candidatus Roizmanbacteria bacterium RIFCSPLOWO2_02_FULL_36_11]
MKKKYKKLNTNLVDYEKWWLQNENANRLDPGTRLRKKIICNEIKLNNKILDLGCGSGELLIEINKKYSNKELYGADISEKALNILRKRKITKQVYQSNLEQDAKLPGVYDAVICSEVIEHLHNWKNVFLLINSITKKNSKVIITTPSGKINPHQIRLGHIQHFELNEIANILRKYNFKIIKAEKIGWPFMNIKDWLITLFLSGDSTKLNNVTFSKKIVLNIFYILYQLTWTDKGPQIIIIAEKN